MRVVNPRFDGEAAASLLRGGLAVAANPLKGVGELILGVSSGCHYRVIIWFGKFIRRKCCQPLSCSTAHEKKQCDPRYHHDPFFVRQNPCH
jgi:hypothetical protein